MSIRSVNKEIRTALTDKVLTQAEAEKIVATAEAGRVTTGEAKQIADLYERSQFAFPQHFPAGVQVMPRPPEFDIETGAKNTLMNFFIEQRVPQGDVYHDVKQDILAVLKKDGDLGAPLAKEPNTKNLHFLQLDDRRAADGNRRDAFLDTEKGEFFLKVTGAGMAGPASVGPFWYGPMEATQLSPTERVADRIDAYTLANKMGLSMSRTHTPRVTDVVAAADGNFEVTMSAVNWRDPSDVRDTKKAIVDAQGEFVRLAEAACASDVGSKVDAWQVAEAVNLGHNRTFTPVVGSVAARDDGNFDVMLQAKHFMNGSVKNQRRVVVNADGQFLPNVAPRITPERADAMKAAFAAQKDDLQFSHNPPPMGARFERVLLEREPGFDTYQYAALVPVGALTPTAIAQDPNEAASIFIERSGGFAGMTSVAGPIGLD